MNTPNCFRITVWRTVFLVTPYEVGMKVHFLVKSENSNGFFIWLDEHGEWVGDTHPKLVRKLGRSIEGWDMTSLFHQAC